MSISIDLLVYFVFNWVIKKSKTNSLNQIHNMDGFIRLFINIIMKFIVIALLGLALTQAVFVKRNNDPNRAVFAQLEAMEEHELGKKLLDTIAL